MSAFNIPSFVWRGLPKKWATEADLRDILATEWWMHGADVTTEVKIPDCGRADIVVRFARRILVIEMKRVVITSAQARDAFQQVDSYVKYMSASVNERFTTDTYVHVDGRVVAAEVLDTATARAERAYTDVEATPINYALGEATWGPVICRDDFLKLAPIARLRRCRVQELADALRSSEIEMTNAIEDLALKELAA